MGVVALHAAAMLQAQNIGDCTKDQRNAKARDPSGVEARNPMIPWLTPKSLNS